MNEKKYVTYLRVSTTKQGASGLGIEAQRKICGDFIAHNNGEAVGEFVDVESGTHRDRKGLLNAINYCKQNGCALVIAKLDRLARDVEFCFKVVNTGIEIHFCDMPTINTLLLGVFAAVAQYERELTSSRTKAALGAKKARGEKVGAAAPKWAQSYASKSDAQKHKEHAKHGQSKNERFLASRDVQAILKAIRNVFPEHCKSDDPTYWAWGRIDTKKENRLRLLALMLDYKQLDTSFTLFADWDLSDFGSEKLRVKLASIIKSIKRALDTKEQRNNN